MGGVGQEEPGGDAEAEGGEAFDYLDCGGISRWSGARADWGPVGGEGIGWGVKRGSHHDPAPGAEAGDVVHVTDAVGEEPAAGPGQSGGDE